MAARRVRAYRGGFERGPGAEPGGGGAEAGGGGSGGGPAVPVHGGISRPPPGFADGRASPQAGELTAPARRAPAGAGSAHAAP